MKLLIFLLLPFFTKAQESYFKLTPTGFTADYIVLEYPGKSKEDLYKKTLLFLNKKYTSPKDVVSKVENESISVNGYSPNSIRRNKLHVFNMDYKIVLEFKDGKIRVNAPTFELTAFNSHQQTLWLIKNNDLGGYDLGIWNNALKLKSELAKQDLETYFNTYIKMLNASITALNDW
jgi:hypothetical protein